MRSFDISNRLVVIPSSELENPSFVEAHLIIDSAINHLKNVNEYFLYYDIIETKKAKEREIRNQYIISSIDEKNYEVYYQEKVNSRTEKVVGLEALSRLKMGGIPISPVEFIKVLEETDMIIKFGFLMLDTSFSHFNLLLSQYGDITVSVNISIIQLTDPDFVTKLINLANKHSVNPSKIILELTESILIMDFKEIDTKLGELKKFGFKLAIDDFGSGYSSLNYLDRLAVDYVKIDKSFIDRILYDEKTKLIVKSVIDIAQQLNIIVISEGVENYDQVLALRDMKCYIIQGYYYSKPKKIV
jgi:EAL domain-containing protein (putative c-di-GMP-specific phosphodiesterase class I)